MSQSVCQATRSREIKLQLGKALIHTGMLVVLVAALSACSTTQEGSIEFERQYSPTISGVVLKSGVPQAGVKLVMSLVDSKQDLCHFSMLQTRTNDQGEFYLGAITAELAGPRIRSLDLQWQVCLEEKEGNKLKRTAIWYDDHYGAIFAPSSSRLSCDLDNLPSQVCQEEPGETALALLSLTPLND